MIRDLYKDLCICHHYKNEHNGKGYYACDGSVTDGQGEVHCYCSGYVEETDADRVRDRDRALAQLRQRWEDERPINLIKAWFRNYFGRR